MTLSRGGGRAFLASRPAGSGSGLYGTDERGPTTQGQRSAQDWEPGKLHPGLSSSFQTVAGTGQLP